MMVMLMYSLDGTAYGGAYDNKIGAFWAAPNRLQDPNLNAVAHELGHSFQLQMLADGSSCWGEKQGGFFEMTSQWMLWQVNPNWIAEETYHWDAFKQASHKAFLHDENVYRSPYVLEYWSERKRTGLHCRTLTEKHRRRRPRTDLPTPERFQGRRKLQICR